MLQHFKEIEVETNPIFIRNKFALVSQQLNTFLDLDSMMNMLLEFYFLIYASLIRKEFEKKNQRLFSLGILRTDHSLQPVLRLIMFLLFKLLLSAHIVQTCKKKPTPSPACVQINAVTFAVLLDLCCISRNST